MIYRRVRTLNLYSSDLLAPADHCTVMGVADARFGDCQGYVELRGKNKPFIFRVFSLRNRNNFSSFVEESRYFWCQTSMRLNSTDFKLSPHTVTDALPNF